MSVQNNKVSNRLTPYIGFNLEKLRKGPSSSFVDITEGPDGSTLYTKWLDPTPEDIYLLPLLSVKNTYIKSFT